MTDTDDPSNEHPAIIYQVLGVIFALAGVADVFAHLYIQHEWNKFDLIGFCTLIAACFALLRPKWFDGMVKWAAEKLPFINYTRPTTEVKDNVS